MATRADTFVSWTWSAVLAGVFASLVVQIILIMLGLGVGLLTVSAATATENTPESRPTPAVIRAR